MSEPGLSALVVVHNEQDILADCLERLIFADEIVVVLDRCTDGSKNIAASFNCRILEGAWEMEGERRNAGIDACAGEWILEADADEWISKSLAREIRGVIADPSGDVFNIPVHNHVGGKWIRYGWGGNFGKNAYPGLFRKGVKKWVNQQPHPELFITGKQGRDLKCAVVHHIDRDISDMIRRLDNYSTAQTGRASGRERG